LINSCIPAFAKRLLRRPNAWAAMRGTEESPGPVGTLRLYQTTAGVLVAAEFWGLPYNPSDPAIPEQFNLRIEDKSPQDAAGSVNIVHTLPPLPANHGYGFGVFLSSRFTIREVTGQRVELFSIIKQKNPQKGGPDTLEKPLALGIIRLN